MEYRPGEIIDQRWKVCRVLQGGLGRVYIVIDQRERIPLAIKTFQAELRDPEVVERFRHESQLWIQAGNHPNIVRAHYFMPLHDDLLLFLEYVDGGDLGDWIGTPRLRSLETVLRLGLEFCDGMLGSGLKAHRDIKPQNCMLTREGCLKITDFGLAKGSRGPRDPALAAYLGQLAEGRVGGPSPSSPALTQAGSMLGTPTHMAPEQFSDAREVDVRADIYSFGVMLFQMLTGRLPFDGDNPLTLLYQHFKIPPPRLDGDAALNELLQACMAKTPEKRPADFVQVRASLASLYHRLTGKSPPEPPAPSRFDVLEQDNRAVCMLNLGLREEAVEILDRCLAHHPGLRQLWSHKGHALNQLGRPAEALACLRRAIEMGEDASTWTEGGLSAELLGDEQVAENSYRRALELDSQYANAYYCLACLEAGQGKLSQALINFKLALSFDPHNAGYRVGQAMTLLNAGRLPEAVEALQECLRREPSNARAWFHLGNCLRAAGDERGAEDSWQRALEHDPAEPRTWVALAKLRLSRKQYAEAVRFLEQADRFGPSQEACELLAMLLVRMERAEDAIGYAEKAVKLNPSSADAWFHLGFAHYTCRRLDHAKVCFQKAQGLGHPQAVAVLAQISG